MRRRVLVALAATVVGGVLWAPNALAAPVTKNLDFSLKGGSHTTIFHKDFGPCCEISIGDPINFDGDIHGNVDLSMDSSMTLPTHHALKYTDTNLRQGRHLDLTNTFTADTSPFDINYTASVDINIYGFDINPTKSKGDSLNCGGPPLTGATCSHTLDFNIASFNPIDIGIAYVHVDFFLAITSTAAINGNGVSTVRTLAVAGAPALGPSTLKFTSSPETKDEGVDLSCSLPKNEPVNYALGDPSDDLSGTVTENVGVGVGGGAAIRDPIFGDHEIFTVGPFNIPLINLPSLTFTPFTLTAPGQNVDLGQLQPNNVPPQIGLVTVSGPNTEGKDEVLTAAVSSPCGADSLHTVWSFSNPNATEPMVAYGANSHIVFPDNGLWTGTVTITDPTGLSTTKDIGTIDIANANPSVAALGDKRAEWGDTIYYHADAFDAKADQGSLAYAWNFGDGSTASGQNVSHVFMTPQAAPGYAGSVSASDKDGGVGTAGFHTIIDKRPTTVVYTGPLSALTKTSVPLSATLTDDHNLPVNGGQVSFALGGQNANAIVDSTGHAATSLLLNQIGNVTYPLSVMYGGNALYSSSLALLPGSGSVPANSFRVNKRGTTVTYLGDLDQRPNHVAMLAARLTDELGQPVAGATMVFSLGAQSISAVTDSTGLASAGLTLNQGPGAYALSAAYAGDGNYNPSSGGPTTFTIPRNNGAVAAIGATANVGASKAGQAARSRVGIRTARKAGKAVHRHVRVVLRRR